ncbi:glycosyltransferase [Paracrocinitomix mangrovi]|uniref:glycosyltransferase n=1 Tax=Paracrocinitomix mangrovi TaxID=2862509 RepID=UPI001C8DECF4|nr:glycosyltransferase [Paracrocinitomix mangrovi]UKN01647.1 glycosyltransferase [Paracrocinitomix mangrovi]
MRLFVLLSRFPYPLEKGDKLRAFHQIKELSKKHEIHLVCLSDQKVKDEWKKEVQQYCKSLNVFELKKGLLYWNTAKQFFTDKPFQVGYFYQKWIQRKINQLIKDIDPDHIYCQLIRTAEYVKNNLNIGKTLDYQDALSKGLYRRAEIAKGIKKSVFLNEAKRLSEYENRIFDYFNHHTIISEQDKNLINHTNKEEIVIVENGISDDFLNYEIKSEAIYELIFVGNMNYPPNVECAEYLATQVLPLLSENTKLGLIGASPNQRVLALAKHPNITVTGWVDDIKMAYASGKIFAAPLFIGTGLQNKLLEAMAIGIPSVTTRLANNALHAKEGEEILLADDAEGFAEQINILLEDEQMQNKLATQAKQFVKTHFNWASSVQKLSDLFESSLSEKRQ